MRTELEFERELGHGSTKEGWRQKTTGYRVEDATARERNRHRSATVDGDCLVATDRGTGFVQRVDGWEKASEFPSEVPHGTVYADRARGLPVGSRDTDTRFGRRIGR
ncbi:hypothetical protein D8S78_04635 [Natrialba swarupiae]|nr:hypothetical protein [Natrialba swarupiae]